MELEKEPEGISFFNVKSGDTHYCKLEPTITAYINSSDMGINASRGQDFGWKLAPEWVKKIRAFQADENKMDTLSAKLRLEDGIMPSTIQILLYIYGREVRAYLQRLREVEAPYAEQYQRDISSVPKEPAIDPVIEDVDETDLPGGEEEEVAAKAEPKPKQK